MKKTIVLLIIATIGAFSCSRAPVKKPENLLGEDRLINILVDVHMAEAAFTSRRYSDTLLRNSTSADFYYSVLQKHQVPDSVFEKSLVFYTSQPRKFERMYRQVMNQLTEMEQNFSGRKEDMQKLDIQQRRQ